MDDEFTETVINNAFELWFLPEIERRKQQGALPDDFQAWAAQVIMDLDHEPVINLNEELQGVVQIEALRKAEMGETIESQGIGKILGLSLTADTPNAAHLTTIFHKGVWYLFFDFRYNATRIKNHLALVQQFLESAGIALSRQHLNAFVENLFSSVEIMAKCYLMIHPDRRVLESKSHGFTATRFNLQRRLGNVPTEFVDLLNRLSNLRPRARYGNGNGTSLGLNTAEAQTLYDQAKRMAQYMDEMRPKRVQL